MNESRWTVLERSSRKRGKETLYWCRCSCGTVREVLISNVKSGRTKSCGCLRKEVTTSRSTAHGHKTRNSPSRTYKSWTSMLARCENPNTPQFKDWGGRGITVCERWHKFENFLEDMGECPPGLTLDRFPDNDGNYELSNCRWATRLEQAQNTRRWI